MTEKTLSRRWQEPDEDERRSARLIPWLFVAFFVVVAAVNAVMITYAETTFTGVTSDHPYEEGIAYNKALAAARTQEKLGWQAAIDFAAPARENLKLAVTLRDRDGAPIEGAQVSARFVRPTSAGFDSALRLNETKPGVYEAAPRLALPGQWDLVVTAAHDGADYQKTERVFVPE
jgi:nitrogen fixation protein FixH